MTRVDWNKLLDLCSSVGFQVRNSLVSSVVCQTYTVAVTHRPFTGHRVKYGLDHWTLGPLDYFLDYFFGLFHGLNFGLFF